MRRTAAILILAAACAAQTSDAPLLLFSTYFGGVGGGSGESIAVDGEGNIIIAGVMNSNHLPLKNPAQEAFYGSNEIFVTKFDPSGEQILFSTYFGSWDDDRAFDVTTDRQGNVYITGQTTSLEFPATPGAYQTVYAGPPPLAVNGGDAFVVKLDSGGRLVYATLLGGSNHDYGRSIAVDREGNVWVFGSTTSADFPLVKPVQESLAPNAENAAATLIPRDFFLAKLSADGSRLLFSTYFGGAGTDEGWAVAVDSADQPVIVGSTTSATPLFPTLNARQTAYGGGTRDLVIAKFDPEGQLLFSTLYGGTGDDFPRAMALDSDASIYVTGYTNNRTFPTRDPFRQYAAGQDAFILKLTPDAQEIAYAGFLGGDGNDQGYGIGVDAQKNVYVAGFTQSRTFPVVNAWQSSIGTNCAALQCVQDVFLAKLNADGQSLAISTYLGGTANDQSRAIAVAPDGAAHVTGITASPNFPLVRPMQDRYGGGGPVVPFVLSFR